MRVPPLQLSQVGKELAVTEAALFCSLGAFLEEKQTPKPDVMFGFFYVWAASDSVRSAFRGTLSTAGFITNPRRMQIRASSNFWSRR